MAKKKPQAAYLAAPEDEPNFDALDQFLGGLEASKPAQELPNRGVLRGMADVALAGGRGAVQGVRMFTDLAGSDNAASRGLRTVEDFIGGLRSAQAKQDDQEAAAILKAAENAGILDQVVAGAKAFAVAPVSTLAQAVGTSIPTIGAALIPGVGQGAAVARMGAALGMGAAQGAGSVKGQIYDEVKQELLQAGASPEEAERRALEASSYDQSGGKIATGAALGALAGSTGMERAIGAIAHGTAKQAPGMARRVLTHGATEALPEAAQGAQEKLASNQALYEQGFDVAPGAGVVAAGTMEGLAGFGMGAAAGLPRPAVRAGDQLRAEGLQPERGPATRALNAAVEAAANKIDFDPSLAAAGQKLQGMAGLEQAGTAPGAAAPKQTFGNEIAYTPDPDTGRLAIGDATEIAKANIANAAAKHEPMSEEDAADLVERASARGMDWTAVPHPEGGGFTVVPREWVTAAMATPQATPAGPSVAERAMQAAESLTLEGDPAVAAAEQEARRAQIQSAPVDRAPRQRTPEPATPAPAVPADVVAAYVESRRNDGTPAGRFFATEFDAGRITRDEVQGLIDAARPKSPDQRLAEAAAQAPKPQAPQPGDILNGLGEPFRNRRAALNVERKNPGSTVIVVDGGWSVRPKESDARTSNAPEPGGPAGEPVADARRGAGTGELRDQRPADVPLGAAGTADEVRAGDGAAAVQPGRTGPAPELTTDIPTLKRQWQAAVQAGDGATARAINERIVALKANAAVQPATEAPASQAAAPGAVAAAPAANVPGAGGGAVEADGVVQRKTLQESRASAALDKQVRDNGEYMTRRQWVERKVSEGMKTRVTQEDRIKPMSRMAYFRATNEEQRAHERRIKDAGKKDVYWIGDYEVTKIEHDYANTLSASPDAPKSKKVAQVKAKREAKATPAPVAPESAASTTQGEGHGQTQEEAQGLLKKEAPADVTTAGATATHADPGEAAEPATPAVVAESITKAAKREDRKPSEMKADLLRQIDAKLADAQDEYLPTWKAPTKDQIRKAMVGTGITNESRIVQMLEGQHQNRVAEAADRIGYVMFDVPGDGKFKVLNTKSKLTDFRRQVESSPGFKNTSSAPKPEGSSGGEKGYGGAKAAIEGMIDEGDAQAAVDYAAMKGLDLAEVLKGQKDRLAKVAGLTPTADGAAPQPEKQEAAPAENRLDNFGEALPPARRNMAAKLTEDLADDDIAKRPLSEIWPLAENEAIEDSFAAAVAHAARAEIPSKPRQPYKLRLWVEKVKTLRGLAGRIVSGEVTRDRMGNLIDTQFRSLRDWWSKVQLLEDVSRDQWKRIGSVEERPDAITYEDGKQVQAPTLRIEVDGKGKWLHGDVGVDGAARGTVGGNKAGIMAMLAAAEPEQRMKFEIRRNTNTGEVFINKEGDTERRRLMTFASVEEARKAIAEQYDELVSQWEGVKARDNITERDLRGAENRPRAGKDHRQGRDVTPNEFQQTFGFRGGEFGKWVEQGKGDKERQALLNSAFDALMDLADMLHIPPRAISLNGTLGIAFGSRGSGWASAHFEPSNLVINLTKTRGAGALAHEWFHALDNYFSRLRRDGEESKFTGDKDKYRNDNYITHQPEALMVRKDRSRHYSPMTASALKARHAARQQKESRTGWPPADAYAPENWERDPSIKTDVRPEVEVRFADLVKALNDSPMTQRSRRLDKGSRGYWGSTLERAARAFENFVQARMQEQGYHNDFLANVLPVEEMRRNPERYPYLLPGEVKPIADAFDALFSEVKTREDDAGNVAMFSRSGASTGRRVDLGSAQALADQLASTGLIRLNVVQSVSDMPLNLQRQLSKSAPDGRVRGAYFRGTDEVWMVADHIRGANEFVEVALHEAFHRGLGKTIPDAKPLLREIWRTNQNVRKATADQMRQHGIGRDEAIEEALAKMAEAGEVRDLKGWPKLLEAIRTWLGKMARAVGIEMVWTDDMVADLVAASTREGLKAGVHADAGAEAASAKRQDAFDRWFGDSKVVDAQGRPLVVYHGTPFDFDVFGGKPVDYVRGFFFSDNPGATPAAMGPGTQIMPVYLSIKKPRVVSSDVLGDVQREYEELKRAKQFGYDGLMGKTEAGETIYVAMRPEQIKSAIGNRGTFDPTDPDIRAKRAPTVTVETDEATGAPVYATDDISIGFPQETERFEYVLGDGEKIVNYSIGPADGFDSYGFVELVIGADGIPKALADIEVKPELRGQAIGEKVMAAILGAHPDADIEISNIVEGARGFWAKMGVPEQNRAAGEAYDGTLNYQTFQEAQDERAANRAAAGRGAAGEGRNAGTEDRAQGADGQAQGLMLSRAEPADATDMRSGPVVRQIQQRAHDLLATKRTFNWWHRTVGTQYHKAQVDADFGKVYTAAQDFIHDTSAFANDPADLAPDLLPQLKSLGDLKKTLGLNKRDRESMAAAVFEGTLDWTRDDSGQPVKAGPDDTAGIVWTPAELRERFGFNDRQVKLYEQFRASVDRSLDTLVASDVVRLLGSDLPPGMRSLVSAGDLGRFKGLVTAYLKDAPGMGDLADQVNEKYARIEELKARGYAPLMRFGRYTVDVVSGDGERKFFGLYESEAEANRAARQFKEGADPGDEVTQGVLSEEAYKQFQGMTPETLELFAEVAGVEKNEVFQEYLKRAKNNRSALKRLIHRKGIAGYSEDASRVLAQFLTSNARAASSNLHLGEMAKAVQDIPKQKGDVIDEAIRLREYVQTPQEEAQALRGLLFASFLGGSVASAMVNLTQPLMMTLPYLSQFGGPAKAAARLMGAMGAALGNYDRDSALGKALAMAEKEGIVSPQEMHQLQAEASGSLAGHPALRRLTFAWGSLFSAAEQFNRRLSFVAAYNTAVAEGKADPAAFAAKAVEETQGVYNKGNKPRFARGTVGAVAFTFKQYSVSYMEFLKRLPTRERTLALAVLLLAAGAQGMPGADDLDDLIDTLGQGLGYDTNAKLWKTRVLSEAIGSDGADFVLRGFSALPGFPLDVAGRLGLGNMIPGTGLLMKSKQDKAGEVAEALGPAASLASGVAKAVPALAGGNLGGVLEGIAPKGIKDLAKALEMYQTGEYRDTKGRKVTDADATDALVKGLGFQPAQVARDSRRVQMANQQIALAKATEAEFADAIARARVDGDPDAELKARQRLADWNASNPESRIVITPAQLARRARELRTTRDDRFVRTAPKEMRQSIKELVQ